MVVASTWVGCPEVLGIFCRVLRGLDLINQYAKDVILVVIRQWLCLRVFFLM
jgi:hypothetical protein